MAEYDGSVRIKTEIDSKNASAQLMSLENRIVKTADKVASLRSKMDSLKNTREQNYKTLLILGKHLLLAATRRNMLTLVKN